ncbi:MAG: ATP-binding protein, partial [Chloroflexota bacterium]|nr:ATP-binding protein [Chloroflexota bacterium]
LSFVQTATNVVLLGPPGVGKTHLASALARKAVEAGHTALFVTLRQFAESVAGATITAWRQQARRYLQPRILVLDEVGYTQLTPFQAQCVFDVVTGRYERSSIVLTSNLSFSEWGSLLGDDVLATALLDRLLHHAEVLNINGRSYRIKERVGADAPHPA